MLPELELRLPAQQTRSQFEEQRFRLPSETILYTLSCGNVFDLVVREDLWSGAVEGVTVHRKDSRQQTKCCETGFCICFPVLQMPVFTRRVKMLTFVNGVFLQAQNRGGTQDARSRSSK